MTTIPAPYQSPLWEPFLYPRWSRWQEGPQQSTQARKAPLTPAKMVSMSSGK